jgi:hypothetical protein
MKNYHAILEIPENSTVEEIKQAYRRLAKQYHPDVNKAHNAHERFIEISEAYEMLMLHASKETQQTETSEEFDYDDFVRKIREAARRQARMRYEKFVREHEAMRESGLYDIGLLLKYIGRVVVPFLALGMIALPFIVSVAEESLAPLGYLFFSWLIGGILLWDAYQRRKGYFRLGKFYYSWERIYGIFIQTHTATEECFYCKGVMANSRPFEITLVKVKDIHLENRGPLQHHAGFKSKDHTIRMPRSQKAFLVHTTVSGVKLLSILLAAVFVPFSSIIWRLIGGCIIGWFLSSIVLLATRTHSKTGYLFNYGIIIKIVVWLAVLALLSKFNTKTGDIKTSDFIQFGVTIMLFVDSLVEQLIKLPRHKHLFKPLIKRYQTLAAYIGENYQLYLEIPVWTTVYPILRWIF